jgi:hypothetical protein
MIISTGSAISIMLAQGILNNSIETKDNNKSELIQNLLYIK